MWLHQKKSKRKEKKNCLSPPVPLITVAIRQNWNLQDSLTRFLPYTFIPIGDNDIPGMSSRFRNRKKKCIYKKTALKMESIDFCSIFSLPKEGPRFLKRFPGKMFIRASRGRLGRKKNIDKRRMSKKKVPTIPKSWMEMIGS